MEYRIDQQYHQQWSLLDYQLNKYNYHYSPAGRIRIARYPTAFWIEKNIGYYGDIYMKAFIRKWKQKTYENKQRRKDKLNAALVIKRLEFVDIGHIVLEFL